MSRKILIFLIIFFIQIILILSQDDEYEKEKEKEKEKPPEPKYWTPQRLYRYLNETYLHKNIQNFLKISFF